MPAIDFTAPLFALQTEPLHLDATTALRVDTQSLQAKPLVFRLEDTDQSRNAAPILPQAHLDDKMLAQEHAAQPHGDWLQSEPLFATALALQQEGDTASTPATSQNDRQAVPRFADVLSESTKPKKLRDTPAAAVPILPSPQLLEATVVALRLPLATVPAAASADPLQAAALKQDAAATGAIILPAGMTLLKDVAADAKVSGPEWLRPIMNEAAVQQHAGGGTARLQVDVPHLGSCECRVTVRGDNVQVHLSVPASQRPLQPELSAISTNLRGLGLHVSEVVVSISETSASDEDAPERDATDRGNNHQEYES